MELLFLPLFFALVTLLLPNNFVRLFGIGGALIALIVSIGHLVYFHPNQYVSLFQALKNPPLNMTFQLGYDGLSFVMVLLTMSVVSLIFIANWNKELAHNKTFTSLVFLMQFGLLGLFLAQDGILFYVFWELTLIPIFLILYWYGQKNNNPILLKFFIYTLFGSLGMLLSFIVAGMYSPSFAYEDLVQSQAPIGALCWITGGFLLAFAIKIPLFPFHTWQPSTYTTAPMAGTILLSALMLKMALFGMIKWMLPMAHESLAYFKWPVITLGSIGIVYGAVIAIKQKDLKAIFAYASISHLGLIAAGIVLFTQAALEGAMIQIINHSIVAVGLFLAAEVIESRTQTRSIYNLGGIAKLAPKFGFWFAVMVFVSVSVPFTAGFIGEFILIKELFSSYWLLGLIAATTLVLGAVYMLRAYQQSMFGPAELSQFEDLKWNETLVFAVLFIAAVGFGLFPQKIIDFVQPSILNMMSLQSIK